MCTSTSLISTNIMNERWNELSKSRWVPPTATKESIRRGSLRGRWNPPPNQASNQTVTFVPSDMNDTSTEKKRKACSTWVSMDTESHWNRANSDQPSVGTLNIRPNLGSPYMKGCETIEELIHLASSHGDLLSTKHLSAFWSRVPQLLNNISSTNSPQQKHEQQLKNDLHCILDITTKKLNRFSHEEIVGTILGMAKVVKHYCTSCTNNHSGSQKSYLSIFQDSIFDQNFNAQPDLFQSMADISASILSSQHMEARLLSNLAYAFALIKRSPHELFDRLSKNIIENASSFEPQGISNVMWAYATLEVASCPRLFEAFAEHMKSKAKLLDMFKLQHFANMVWAFSAAHISNTMLFDRVAEIIATTVGTNFKSQELSTILLAYTRNSHSSPKLFTKVAQVIIAQVDLKVFNPQDLSITVWAYATADESQPLLFKTFAYHIVELDNLDEFIPQHLAKILWSYAKIGEHNHADLFNKIASAIITRDLGAFELRHLSITAWAFATVNILHPKLFNIISDAAISRKCELQDQDTTNLLWAFASIGRVDDDLRIFVSLLPRVQEVMKDFTCQGLANIVWAYAIANVASPDLDCAFIAALQSKEHQFIDSDLRQLHQWQLWKLELGSLTSLPSSLRQRCYDAFIMDRSHPSRLQNDVVKELTSMGFHPQEEMLLTCSGYRLEACVLVHGEKVGIEVDGPFHFNGFKPTKKSII